MSSSKKFTCKGTLRQVFIRVLDWRYSQSCWYFRLSFVNCWPSNLSLVQLPCVKVQYMKTVCGWEGVGGVEPVETINFSAGV
jgi:hypothetical protein